MRTNIEKILVFQQSRVKDYNFDEWKAERSAENKTKSKNGEKARAFLLQLEKCTKKLKQFKERETAEEKIFCKKFKRTRA